MLSEIISALIQFAILLPFMLIMVEHTRLNYQRVLIMAFCFITVKCLLILPLYFQAFKIVGGHWNWSGKVFAILGCVGLYRSFRNKFSQHDFFTLKQKPGSLRISFLTTVAVTLLAAILWYVLSSGNRPLEMETLAFQALVPGLDEEMLYRGILLGLLLSVQPEKKWASMNANVLIAFLFGMAHALQLDKSFKLNFNLFYMAQTFIGGLLYGWIALRSRSILWPVVAHNSSNFFGVLVTMVKS